MMQDKDTPGFPDQISTRTSDTPMAFRLGFLGRWGAWIVLLVSLLTSFAAWYIVKGEATKRAQARFNFQVEAIKTGIHERLKAYELLLLGGVGLFEASAEVTREDWQLYVKTLRIDQHYPGIQGVGFSRRILPTEKAAHLRQIRRQGFPQYTIKPDGERSEYTSIIFLEPFDWRNQRAFGYDMFSEATRKEAMIRARDTGKAALSGKVTLVQETGKDVQAGFLIYMAVYRKGEPLGTLEQRRKALTGYVYSPFRMNDFMQGIVAGDEAQVGFQIFDGDKQLKETPLYQSGIVEEPHHSPEDRHFATHQSILEYAGHRWLLEFASSKYFENQIETGLTTFILMLGIAISLLLFGMVLSLTRSRGRAIALANMTLNLEKANIGLREEITERKRTEETIQRSKKNLDEAQRISRVGSWEYDVATDTAVWSDNMFRIFDVDPAAPRALVFKNFVEHLVSPGDRTRIVQTLKNALAGGPPYDLEYRINRQDGTERIIHASAEIQRDSSGLAVHLIGTVQDITDRRQAEDQIKSLLADKELLLREVHHRIKNNMNTMKSLLSLQAGKQKDPSVTAALREAANRLQSMSVLYDKLYRSENLRELPAGTYLTPLVKEIVGTFPTDITVETEVAIDDFILPVKLLSPIGIIVNELITNAMKYAFTGRNDGLISVSATKKDTHVTLMIGDNGVGIADTIDLKESDSFGLYLVHILTEQIGGTITAEQG